MPHAQWNQWNAFLARQRKPYIPVLRCRTGSHTHPHLTILQMNELGDALHKAESDWGSDTELGEFETRAAMCYDRTLEEVY